jgi:DNA repair protein RadC
MLMEQVTEITVSYRTKVKAADRPKISRSGDAHKLLFDLWNKDTIEYQECFYILLLK